MKTKTILDAWQIAVYLTYDEHGYVIDQKHSDQASRLYKRLLLRIEQGDRAREALENIGGILARKDDSDKVVDVWMEYINYAHDTQP